MKIDSNNLIRELKNKNEKALDYLYETHISIAYKIVLDNLENIASKEDIEECVSDIFVSVWNNIDKYNEKIAKFKTWFSAVCKYKAIDYKRSIKTKALSVELDENTLIEPVSVEDRILAEEDVCDLIEIIDDMPHIDRQIFIRRYILNEKIDDISKDLGITRGAIDNRLSRGRKTIKNKWLKLIGR